METDHDVVANAPIAGPLDNDPFGGELTGSNLYLLGLLPADKWHDLRNDRRSVEQTYRDMSVFTGYNFLVLLST